MDYDFIENLYRDCFEKVKIVVLSTIYSKNVDDVSSCVQDVFVTAMKKEGLENHPNVEGWLYLTAKNITLRFNEKYLYRLKKNADIEDLELPHADFSEQLVEDISFDQLSGEIIERIMGAMSPSERDFYMLKYGQRLDNKEIAEMLNVTVGAIITRNSRLKAKIKQLLRQELEKSDLL